MKCVCEELRDALKWAIGKLSNYEYENFMSDPNHMIRNALRRSAWITGNNLKGKNRIYVEMTGIGYDAFFYADGKKYIALRVSGIEYDRIIEYARKYNMEIIKVK